MTDAEIIETIARLQKGEVSDKESGKLLERLKKETRCPNIGDLIFYGNDSDTPEAILRKAREYRPFEL